MPNLNFAELYRQTTKLHPQPDQNTQIPDYSGTSSAQPLQQGPGLTVSFIPNQLLPRQAKSLELFMPGCIP